MTFYLHFFAAAVGETYGLKACTITAGTYRRELAGFKMTKPFPNKLWQIARPLTLPRRAKAVGCWLELPTTPDQIDMRMEWVPGWGSTEDMAVHELTMHLIPAEGGILASPLASVWPEMPDLYGDNSPMRVTPALYAGGNHLPKLTCIERTEHWPGVPKLVRSVVHAPVLDTAAMAQAMEWGALPGLDYVLPQDAIEQA